MKEVWGHWLSEIMSFSSLPGFFDMFFSERQYQTILFDIISGNPDADTLQAEKERQEEIEKRKKGTDKKKKNGMWGGGGYGYNANKNKEDIDVPERDNPWIDKQLQVVKFSYSIVQKIFDANAQNISVVEKFIENGTITKLVERLGYLTGEKG